MHVGTIMESNDATFFEDIFPMKDMSTSSNQEIPTLSSQELVVFCEPTIAWNTLRILLRVTIELL